MATTRTRTRTSSASNWNANDDNDNNKKDSSTTRRSTKSKASTSAAAVEEEREEQHHIENEEGDAAANEIDNNNNNSNNSDDDEEQKQKKTRASTKKRTAAAAAAATTTATSKKTTAAKKKSNNNNNNKSVEEQENASTTTNSNKQKKRELMSTIDANDMHAFLQFVRKEKGDMLKELLQTLTNAETERLWNFVGGIGVDNDNESTHVIADIFAKKQFTYLADDRIRDADTDEDEEQSKVKQARDALEVISTVAMLLDAYVQEGASLDNESLRNLLVNLHDVLLELGVNSDGEKAQAQLAAVCERIYLQEVQKKRDEAAAAAAAAAASTGTEGAAEDAAALVGIDTNNWAHALVPQMFSYFVACALEMDAKQADIKRVFNMRTALTLFDFTDESITSLQELLLRCVISPLFLKYTEGKRFIIYMFTLNTTLCDIVHAAIISQIPSCRKSILDAYGEIYFKAWKLSTGQCLLKIEYNCVQDLMYRAIHARTHELFSNLRRILYAFHSEKKHKGVDEMLLRLYEPILFRSLNVANALVRRNSAALFVEAFPLRDPDASAAETEMRLQTQLGLLKDLLNDVNVNVRCVGVEGTCRILGTFWELIPKQDIYELLNILVKKLAFDASSSAVRISVFKGLSFLLDNHLTHPLLKKMLPTLRPLINDNTQGVRFAFLSLLYRVKSVRSIKYYDIVPVDTLLYRLAVDGWSTPPMASSAANKSNKGLSASSSAAAADDAYSGQGTMIGEKISSLLLNSYFPYNKLASEQLDRYLAMMQSNTLATRNFFKCITYFTMVPLPAVCKFISILNKFVSKCISMAQEEALLHEAEEQEEEEEQQASNKNKKKASKTNKKTKKVGDSNTKKRKKPQDKGDDGDDDDDDVVEDEEEEDGEAQVVAATKDSDKITLKQASKNIPLLEATIEMMAILLEGVGNDLKKEENSEMHQYIANKVFTTDNFNALQRLGGGGSSNVSLNESIILMSSTSLSPRVSAALWTIAKHLPQKNVRKLVDTSIKKIEEMCEGGAVNSDCRFILDCVCEWNNEAQFLDIITKYIQAAAASSSSGSKNRKKKSANNNNNNIERRQASVALYLLNAALSNPKSRSAILEQTKKMDKLASLLADKLIAERLCSRIAVVTSAAEDGDDNDDGQQQEAEEEEELLVSCLHMYPKLVLHRITRKLNNETAASRLKVDKINALFAETPSEIVDVLEMYNKMVLAALVGGDEDDEHQQQHQVIKKKAKTTMTTTKKSKKSKKRKQSGDDGDYNNSNNNNNEEQEEEEEEAEGKSSVLKAFHLRVVESMITWINEFITVGVLRPPPTTTTTTMKSKKKKKKNDDGEEGEDPNNTSAVEVVVGSNNAAAEQLVQEFIACFTQRPQMQVYVVPLFQHFAKLSYQLLDTATTTTTTTTITNESSGRSSSSSGGGSVGDHFNASTYIQTFVDLAGSAYGTHYKAFAKRWFLNGRNGDVLAVAADKMHEANVRAVQEVIKLCMRPTTRLTHMPASEGADDDDVGAGSQLAKLMLVKAIQAMECPEEGSDDAPTLLRDRDDLPPCTAFCLDVVTHHYATTTTVEKAVASESAAASTTTTTAEGSNKDANNKEKDTAATTATPASASTPLDKFLRIFVSELLEVFEIEDLDEQFIYKSFQILSVLLLDYKIVLTDKKGQINSVLQQLIQRPSNNDIYGLRSLAEELIQRQEKQQQASSSSSAEESEQQDDHNNDDNEADKQE